MAILLRILRHTFRFPWQSGLSLLLAFACTLLVLVLPGITMVFIDEIIEKKRPDLILPTAAIGIGAIFLRQALFTLRTYFNNALELKLTHLIRVELYDKLQRLPVKWFDTNSSGEIMSRVANDVPTTNRIIIDGVDQAIAALLQFVVVMSATCSGNRGNSPSSPSFPCPSSALSPPGGAAGRNPCGANPPKPAPRSTPSSTTTSPASARSRPTPSSPRPSKPSTRHPARSGRNT